MPREEVRVDASLLSILSGIGVGAIVGALVTGALTRSNEAARWKRETRMQCYARFNSLAWQAQRDTVAFARFHMAFAHGMNEESVQTSAELCGRLRQLHADLRDLASEVQLLAGDDVLREAANVHDLVLKLFPVARGIPGEGTHAHLAGQDRELNRVRAAFIDAARRELGVGPLPTIRERELFPNLDLSPGPRDDLESEEAQPPSR
jgi:hypothetical protein